MMEKSMLVILPDFDDTTDYLSRWSAPVIEVAKSKSVKVFVLPGKEANKANLEKRLSGKKYSLVFFNGHGSKEYICGQQNEKLIDEENCHLLDSAIVYSRSCDSAAILGKKVVSEGNVKAFVGYSQAFIFVKNNARSATPMKDNYAKPCLESSNMVPQALINGSTTEQAVEKAQTHSDKEIEYLKTHYSPENSHILFALEWNKTVLKVIGDQNATI